MSQVSWKVIEERKPNFGKEEQESFFMGWEDSSIVKALAAFPEDLGSIRNSYMIAHKHL